MLYASLLINKVRYIYINIKHKQTKIIMSYFSRLKIIHIFIIITKMLFYLKTKN